jgi:hypothetical protein
MGPLDLASVEPIVPAHHSFVGCSPDLCIRGVVSSDISAGTVVRSTTLRFPMVTLLVILDWYTAIDWRADRNVHGSMTMLLTPGYAHCWCLLAGNFICFAGSVE